MFCKKRCSWKFCKIHRKTPVPECLNKVAGLRSATLLKKRLWQKRDSGTSVFLWILRNFQEHLFQEAPPVAASKNGKTVADYMYIQHSITEVSQLVSEGKDKSYIKIAMELNNPIAHLAVSLQVFRRVILHKLKVPQTCDDVRLSFWFNVLEGDVEMLNISVNPHVFFR